MAKGTMRAVHGQHIYAYCNVRTNQVLYSLDRTLRNGHLKQLADVGANNNPPKLRKDVWRPLWTVSLPNTPAGPQQGLALFKQLREYRMLHETNWEIPEEMSRPMTEKQIETAKRRLENRGGSKKESVYDIIKRQKWKIRVHMVMNQKANSIADLAAILLRQEEKGVTVREQQEQALRLQKQRNQETIVALATANETNAESVRAKIPVMEAEVAEAEQIAQNKDNKSKERRAAFQKALHTRRDIEKTQLEIRRMEWSATQVAQAKARAATAQKAADEAAAREQKETTAASPKTSQGATDVEKTPAQAQSGAVPQIDFRQYLPDFPPELDPIAAAKAGIRIPKGSPLQPDDKKLEKLARLVRQPAYTAQDITVKWANILDAEFAEAWPAGVKHDRLGFVRNTAPKPDDEPVDDVKTFKGIDTDEQDPEEVAAETAVEKAAKRQRSAILKRISESIIEKVIRPGMPNSSRRKAYMAERQSRKNSAAEAPSPMEAATNDPVTEPEASEPPVQGDAPKL